MTLSLEPIESERPAHVVFDNASWELYEQLLKEIGNGTTRVTYDQGRMEVMSPLPKHERTKKLIARLLETVAFDFNIPIASYGSTTYKMEEAKVGLEPDECYYVAHESQMRDRDRIDLSIDPPPDLVLEVDISYRNVKRESIYAKMGVPEVWRYDGSTLECLLLNDKRDYVASEFSRAFPFLRPSEICRFADLVERTGELGMVTAFREWLKTLPR